MLEQRIPNNITHNASYGGKNTHRESGKLYSHIIPKFAVPILSFNNNKIKQLVSRENKIRKSSRR